MTVKRLNIAVLLGTTVRRTASELRKSSIKIIQLKSNAFEIPNRYMTVFKATTFYFLPLTIIGILYTLMARKLQNSAREVQNIASAGCRSKNPQAQNRRHVARMVMVFILGLFWLQIESTECFQFKNFHSLLSRLSQQFSLFVSYLTGFSNSGSGFRTARRITIYFGITLES